MANSTNIDPKVLQDYVATANSGKYSSWDEIDSKFPEFKNVDKKILQDYVATANSGKYKSWDEINGKFPEFFKKKSRVEQAPKSQNLSGTGLAPTQPGDGSRPARFIGAGDQVSNADKDAILKFAQQQQKTTPTKELSREDIQARIRKGQYEDAAKGLREKASVNVLEQAPSVEKGPVIMSEDDPRYQERVEEQRKIEQQFENEKQSVISYLRYSPKDILLDEDALNEDIEYLKKEKGFSDKAIMEGVEEAKRQRQRKKGDKVLNSMYSSTMSQLYPDMDETVSDDQKKKMAEGAVFSKAIQTGVENMTEDERSAYVLLGELKKVNEQLVASPGDNALVVKSAELKTKIGNLLDNPKMLFDPVTGEMVDKSNANAQKYESEVNAEASKMKAETTEDKLAKNYMQKWADFKYWDGLYDQNQRNLAKQGTLGISPDDWNNKKIREAQTLKANWIKAKKDFDVATRSYMLNRDPSGVKRDYGVKAAGEVLLESLTPGLVQDMLPEGILPLTDKTYLEIVQGQLPEAGIELTPEMKKRFEKTLTEEIVEGAGGLAGILPKLWIAGRIVQTGTFLTGIDDAIRVLSNGNRFEKILAFGMRGGAEEIKTTMVGFNLGVGFGFQAASETIRLPRLSGKFGVIMQPAFDAAVAGSIGGTVGMELGEVIAKTVDSLNSNQEWMAKMEELFPDFDTVERRIVTNLVLNGLFGLTHIPKGSLTFSPEKLTEMAYKLKDKGMKQEADYLLKRAAELGGYKKIDLQIAMGATGVAGRKAEQEQRPVVKPAAPVVQPPAPEVKAEEVAPEVKAPAPEVKPAVTKPVVEAKPKEISPITIEESINSQKVYDREGEKGVIKKEGQIVVLEKANGDVIELGNIDQVKDKSISDFNIKETVDIILNDDNTFDVDGKKYVNNYSTPESAISVDKDGNYSVTLDTPDGKKRTFRGERGEEMAYQIKLKQIENERNEQTIDRAIELTDEALAAETKPGEVAPKEEVRVTSEVEPTKPIEDAVQIETTGKVPVQPEARVGEQVAQGKPEAEPQKVAQEGRPQEVEGAAPAKAKEPAPKKKTGGKKEPVVETKAEEPPAVETKPWKPTGTTKETVDIETLKEEVDKNGRPLSEFKDGDVVILAFKANDAWDLYTEGTISRKDGEVRLIRFKENPVSKRFKFTYLSENTKVIPKPEGDPIYIGPEDFKIEKPSPKGEKPATEGEFWTNEKSFSVQPKVGDIVDFDGKKHEVLQKTKVGKEQKYLLKEQPKAEEPVPAPKEEVPVDAATFLKEKLKLQTKPGEKAEEPAPAAKEEKPAETRTTEEKIAEAQKTVDDAAKWLKDKLKINTLPPDTKTMGTSSEALIDLAADAVKQLVATGIKTADAVKQVIDALREGGYLKGIDEKEFTAKVSGVEQPKPTGKIEWKPAVQDKKIAKRNPVVTEAARRLMKGEITNQQYRDIVEQNSPIGPITNFIEPATEQQVKNAVSSEKVKNVNKPIKQGEKVGLRLDIPSFERNNTWVVSVHEGHSKKSPVLSYTSVARITNASFGAAPNETIKMAAGSYKDAVSKIYGEWSELPGKDLAEKAENAKALVEEIANDPNWVQVGLNPFRHSYFYDRSSDKGRPLISADEVIQIGGLVYAKNPVYGKWTDAAYRVKGLLDAAGKEIRFSKRTGEPEGAKPVDVKEKEIIDEMNSMELVNKGVSIEAKSTTDKKINTEELNSSLDTPLEVVDFKNYEGIPFIFTISDQLRTGDTVNPFTGEVISDLKGGLGFNGTKGNENAAWANTTAAEGNATVERAMYVYNKNKALFDRLWKEGRLPDGHIPMAVVKMGETSILSNEAVFRVGIQNIQTLPMSNRNKATVVLKQTLKEKIAETKRLIAKGADPKTGEKYSENTMNSKKKQLAQYENILDILNQNKYKDIVDVLKDNKNFSLPEKAIIINQVFYGVPTTIGGKPIDINRSKAKTPVSKALIGNKNPELINIGRITDLLTEPSMKEIPSMHIISIVAVDVKNPGLVKTTHPNYEFGPRGKSIGVLEQPIHMKDAFGEAYGSVVSKVAKNEANDKSITPTQALQQGIPVQSGLPNKVYQAAVAKGRLDAVDKLAGFVRQVFPKTTFFTSKEAWETIMADPSVKKQMKDGDVVYGITADGQVYLNPNLKNTKVLLHESGHIWEDFVKENNPKLWEKGESLVSNTKELAEAQKVYGDTPRARSEAIMEIMSTKGDTIVNAAQKADFKEWMVGLWKYISDKFSSLLGLSPKEIENLTLDKFVEGMLADILSGKELKAGKHVADTKPSKAEMAENARFSKEGTTPTTTERQIAEAERTIDNAAAWLKEKLKVTTLPEGTQKMGMSQEDLIDLVALAAKKLVSKGAKVSQAIKQVLDSLREGGFLTNMDEKAITSGSRRRMSPSYETDMYKIHERLVDMAKDYIANGGTSRKEFAYQVGVKEKNVDQAWEEANGVRTFNKDQIDRRLADITRTAIMRGFNVRTRLDELLQTNRDIRSAINNFMKLKELYAVVNPVQAKALARRAANVRTMEQLDKFIEYADKVINDANYAQDMADIRKMQDAAKRVKHTGNTKAVKDFASINPESIPENRRDEYIQALDELAGRVPNYATMQRIYFDIVGAPKKARDFSNITTFNKAADIFNSIMSNKIESVEDYRKLFSDINGLKRRLNQLVEDGTITMDEFNTIMDQIGTTTDQVKQKFASGITKLKNDLITDIRSKTLDYRPQNKEEQRMIDSFKEQNNDDLRRMEPEDLWELNELIDRANDGNFDYYRWNGVLAEAEKIRRGELVGKQLQGAKMLNTTTAARKLAKQESTFIEGVLGLGRSQAGAVSKYVVSEVERAAGNYSLGIKDGLNELMKAKGNLDKKSMHKIGMVVTYLQEYMAQFNPKYKNTQDIGTRDWFGKILSDAGMTNTYASESVNLGTLRTQSKEKIIRDLYDSMPKDANGNVSPKAVYESIMAKDGRFLSNKEQEMLDAVMEFIDKEVKPKQESANFSRGMDFEALSFYMPRIDLKQRGDIEAKVETNRNRVRIKSGFGEERTSQEVRPIEVDFESAITSAIEAANRDYYFGKALDMVSGTLGYAAKQGDIAKNTAEILATNIKDMMEFEFARKQSDAAAALSGLALGARAAQTLLNPIRTVMVELPATYIQVPLRSRNVSGYVDIINPTNGKLFRDLLDYSESPLRLRENISSAIDIDQGAIKPQSFKDKALVFLAGAPERITMIGSWMPTFKNEFFKLTGEKFDAGKFSSDPNYRKKFNRAIKEAATSADMTTQKIIGVTTKLSQARELELPGEGTLYQKGVSKDEILGKTLGFFGNYPRREYLEFINGFKEIAERYRSGEGAASLTSISKPLSVAIGTLTYGYMASLVYTLTKAYFGTENEKEKAQEELERLSNTQGIVEEGISQGIALAGSKYYAAGRIATSLLTLAAYNMTEDPERKKNIARMYKNTYYADPIDPDGSKTFLSKDNKEKMALWIIKTAIPQLALVVDKYQQGLEAYGGIEKLMDRYDEVGFSGLADEERDLWLLGDIILKTGGIVANLYGTAIPMEKTLQMYVRGQYEAVPLSKDDTRETMQGRIDSRNKTPEERKETFEERIKRKKREMELRKKSREYGIPYVKPR